MVFQQGALFEWMNVRENVGFGPRMKGVNAAQAREKVDHLLEIVVFRISRKKPSMNFLAACSSVLLWPAV